MKKIFLLIFLFYLGGAVQAQEEAYNWFFGENAGIKFSNDGTVIPVTGGQLNTREGCASISDLNGDLLFYTDGSIVYNKNHSVMTNGSGLLGDASSTQSAIVVPKPFDPDIYYIFTVGSTINPNGLKYSIVDMSQSGGLGSVIQKNINLLNKSSEKVSAVLKDCDSQEIWVITLANQNGGGGSWDTFYAYLIDSSGVNTSPVTSFFPLGITDSRGYLKFSPDGTKLVCANIDNGLWLFDFDTNTGLVSNPLALPINDPTSNQPYGVEFSPDNNLLYVTASNDFFSQDGSDQNPANHQSVLVQFNLNATDIVNSQVLIDIRQLYRGGLQLGPNGKIYRALSATYDQGIPALGVINNPNAIGSACNYQHNAVDLGTMRSTQGLPPFIQSFFNQKIDIIQNSTTFSTYLPLCNGDTYTLTAEDIPGATYTWSMDGILLPETDYDLFVNQAGHYEVLIELNTEDCDKREGEAFVEYFDDPIAYDATLLQCDEDGQPDDGLTVFNLEQAVPDLTGNDTNLHVKFFKTLQDLNNEINELDPSSYPNETNPQILHTLIVNNVSGCATPSELTLRVSTTQINDYVVPPVCDELGSEDGINTFNLEEVANAMLNGLPNDVTILFYATYDDALLEQNQLPSNFTNTTAYNQTLFARAENDNDCYGISEVRLRVAPLPKFGEDGLEYYCLNFFPATITLENGLLDTNTGGYTYLWSTGENTPTIQVNETGNYTITVTNSYGCSQSRNIVVEASNIATINDIEVMDGSESFNNTVMVFASGEGIYQYALFGTNGIIANYQDENVFENVPPGIHVVSVMDTKNDCGVVEQLISVIGFPKYFTPNNDGYNDTWQVYGISEQFQPNTKILIFDRYGKLLKQLDPLDRGWDGTFNGVPLPNSDYWFAVTLQDGRVFKSHFSLKR